ncbi:hypothetical protein B0T18DRAFT_54825 [Schizothecium vesticola]|uniref:Secreted protein n=1 Tax=Schizothecium vesticola TaxID=314040 RepID=A0AA40F3R3_9PEZI|nr:hypothetical protein B0T18DRAFT_54825 [Schizothecium vesticola]
MHLSHVLPLFAGLAAALPTEVEPVVSREYLAAAPSGHEVQITGIAFAGSGCPANSVSGQLSTDLTTITLLYTSFVAESGAGQPSSNQRKNCQLNVKLKYPAGWQFSIFKADYRGYANIARGDTGTCKATYYFSGDSKQISSTLTIKGPYDDNYLKTDQFGVESTVWSPCGLEGLLNINSEVRVSPANSQSKSQLTVRTLGNMTLQWQNCGSDGSSGQPQWPINPDPVVLEPTEPAPEYPEDETPGDLPPLEPETGV